MLTIQEVKTMYFDKQALREPVRKLRRIDGGDIRWYYTIENGEIIWMISVTSLISSTMPMGEQLIKWIADRGYEQAKKERDEKARYGTAMHIAFGKFLLGKFDLNYTAIVQFLLNEGVPVSYANQLQKDVLSFAQFCNDYDVKPLAVEILLSDTDLGLAGACDLVCQMTVSRKRVIAMLDFKSGRKGFWEEAEIQLQAYKTLFENEFPDITIERLYNWSPKDWIKSPTYNLVDQTDKRSGQKLEHMIELFRLSGVQKPSPRIEVRGSIGLGMSLNDKFRVIDFEQFIKETDDYFRQYINIPNVSVAEDVPFLTDDEVVESPFNFDVKTNYLDF